MSNGKQGPPLEIPDFDKSTGKGSLVSPKQLLSQAKKGVGKAAKAVRHRGKRQNVNPLNLAASQASATSRRHLEDQSHIVPGGEDPGTRTIHFGPGSENPPFMGNSIKTAKYNIVTFLPIFLFEMFSRAAYLYFLLQACLSWWSIVSPFGGFGSTAAIVFVLLVAAGKALWEDAKRHQEDRRTNASVAHVLQADGSVADITWRDVKVGQLLLVRDDELFPADLLCLWSELPERVCFIKTTNLDGETNLKNRRPLDLKQDSAAGQQGATELAGTLQCEAPSQNLHSFQGRFIPRSSGKQYPVTINEMLLRGCTLKNSKSIIGAVVYTGNESRIQKNSAKTPHKIGSFDHFLNFQIAFIILLQIGMCVFCAVGSYIWRQQYGYRRYHLAMDAYTQGNYENGAAYTFILLITFWILYSYLVPISLFVTMEIVKFWQGFIYINLDKAMQDPATKEFSRARNTNLNEDLGKIDYVFSDKTGTLTSNEMQLREIAIKGVPFGDSTFRLEDNRQMAPQQALQRFDPRLASALATVNQDTTLGELMAEGGSAPHVLSLASSQPSSQELHGQDGDGRLAQGAEGGDLHSLVLGHHVVDFFLNLTLCQQLIVEENPLGPEHPPVYQGSSPDEVALVDGARALGFEFVGMSGADYTVSMAGVRTVYQVQQVLEFSSDRGRMSVIYRMEDGSVRLFAKGSDAKMLAIMSPSTPKDLLEATNKNLHLFATQGLRTLVLGTKLLDPEWFQDWDERYEQAKGALTQRDERLAELAREIEQGLELVGATAIEDKLQEGVPAAIATLLAAGIRVWVITGDKQETAINIAISCKLIRYPDSLLICNASSPKAAEQRLQDLDRQLDKAFAPVGKHHHTASPEVGNPVHPGELVIDGATLSHILGTPAEELLAACGARCGSVVICRSSPAQKAAIVRMMAEYEMRQAEGGSKGMVRWYKRQMKKQAGRMLAIGDGANDVAMIQAADIGIGIMGKEGRQAVNNSDYAIGQFRFLTRLLLVHGQLSTYRLSRLIKYSFYKNVAFGFLLFFYQFYNGYSGQALVDDISAAVYNVVFTSIPILLFSVLDRPVKHLDTLLRFPQSYNEKGSLTTSTFWRNGVLLAIVDAAICFFFTYYSINTHGIESATDVYSVGKGAFIALLGTVTLEVCLVARYWTKLFVVFVLLSYWLVYPFEIIFPLVEQWFSVADSAQYGVAQYVFRTPSFWFVCLLANMTTFGHRYIERAAIWLFRPNDDMILCEIEAEEKGKPDYSWQTADRLSALSYSKHNPEAAQHQNGGHAGTNGMNGFGHTPNASSGPSWGMADMPPMPSSAKGGRPGFRGSARRRPEGPGSVELLPSSSVPSHADVV